MSGIEVSTWGNWLSLLLLKLKDKEKLDAFDQLGRTILAGLAVAHHRLAAADDSAPAVRLPGPSLGLGDDTRHFSMTPGGTLPEDGDQRFRRFEVGTLDAHGKFTADMVATGVPAFTAAQMVSIMTDTNDRYGRFVSLFDDDTDVTGNGRDDEAEVGAGNDTADLGAGDDLLRKWKAGDLTYDGGSGFDSLSFDRAEGNAVTHPGGVDVNLATGTGTTPFGGQLTVTDVEAVSGTSLADRLIGDARRNSFFSGKGGADTIRGGGGNDAILVDHDFGVVAAGRVFDGGSGHDTLTVYGDGPATVNLLDLEDQGLNTGVFAGGRFTGFESFVFLTPGFTFYSFDVAGTDASESFRAGPGNDILDGRGGDDTFIETGGADQWIGGAGRDRVDFSLFYVAVTVDLAAGTGAGGNAEGDRFDGIEDVTGSRGGDLLQGSGASNRLWGDDGDDTLAGRGGGDRLTGGLGRDTMVGGGGADRFVFTQLGDSGASRATADSIRGFEAGEDVIDISGLDAGGREHFRFVTGDFTGVGQVHVASGPGGSLIELNLAGSDAADMVIRVTGDVPAAADFVL